MWPIPPKQAFFACPSGNGLDCVIFKSRIVRFLGEGNFGQVYLAKNQAYNTGNASKSFAIKICSDDAGSIDTKEPFIIRFGRFD